MDKLSIQGIAMMYDRSIEEVKKAVEGMKTELYTIDINDETYSIELYDTESIREVGYKLFGRPYEDQYEMSDFDKKMKQAIDFNPNE